MTTLTFALPKDIVVELRSDRELPYTRREELLFKAYVPGIARIERRNPDITITHTQSRNRRCSFDGNHIAIEDEWTTIPDDVYHLLYSAGRAELLRKGMYCVHAACVDIDGLVLIAGHSGSGKTTTALELLARGHKIFSGNKTAVSIETGIEAVAGTTTMTGRTKDVGERTGAITYGDRSAFPLIEYASQGQVKAVYFVRLSDREEERELSDLSALHTAYPSFLDTVNADTIVLGKHLYKGAADGQPLVDKLRRTLPTIRTYRIAGPLDFIVDRMVAHER